MTNLTEKYGNLASGIMGSTLPKLDTQVGTEATILRGRDRHPAKVAGIVLNKSGNVKGYMLQRYHWTIDMESEGYAKEIRWDEPNGSPSFHKVATHGKLKGTIKDAFIGRAEPFYDRSF